MMKLDARLKLLELSTKPATLLPTVVADCTTDEEIERLRQTGQKVFRSSDPALFDSFIL